MTMAKSVSFTLNGHAVAAEPGESILQAAARHGVEIPHLCYCEGQRADGNCRSCVVEIEGERALAPSCRRQPTAGMAVSSDSMRARNAQRGVLELLLSDVESSHEKTDSELQHWVNKLNANPNRYPARVNHPAADHSHPAITVDLSACIHCGRCLRACREEQVNDVIGWVGRGAATQVGFDLDDNLVSSSCVACGECVQACPTGALGLVAADPVEADKEIDSVCPYCGVGCLLTYQIKGDRLIAVQGRDGATNHRRLCVKGRFGGDYHYHPDRLLHPLIRRDDVPKQALLPDDPALIRSWFREASWDEALDRAATGFQRIKQQQGGGALAGFGSAKGSNEEAYLFQKLIRTGFGTHNVDHCTRLCHASSVAALLEGIGSGAVSNPVADVAHADLILVIGANPDSNHPVASSFIKNAAKAGATLIVADPRRIPLARHATHFLQFQPDSDVAMLNALLCTLIEEDLVDHAFIAARTQGYDELKQSVRRFTPEKMAPICGIEASRLRQVARAFATAGNAMIFWGMGVSQHIHGTDNVRCLIALALLCGQIGRPGTGLHPLRGQNNVQGASDAGLIPMMLPDYQRVDNADARRRFEQAWDCTLPATSGKTVVEIMEAAHQGEIRGLYVMGENPAMSDPNLNHTRAAIARLEHLVVQDLFITETAAYADVILPASGFAEKTGSFTNTDRRVQCGRQALQLPGDARQDLWIIQQLAKRLGLPWRDQPASDVFMEMQQLMPSIAGISWQRLQAEDSITYPCTTSDDPGQRVLFGDRFPTPNGKAKLVSTELIQADELPNDDYPLVLLTGRQLEHWHTGAMTRRSRVLDALEPGPWVAIHPEQRTGLCLNDGDTITLESRRGHIRVAVHDDASLQPGQLFMPFCYAEAAINLLTNDALDPFGKIAELKYCAVRIAP
ncbi:formate dehydrogenase subunit alpha [Motiliproteus sediminis]|uniref:formate dehydrogenase subunit alpha n=1 Tax=Motiliproteus sediminis TaxID=1468178 RepID=UPI001AEF7127|nr:formate dehydrogenase subunit alpha [Motiliproteus sediminis]